MHMKTIHRQSQEKEVEEEGEEEKEDDLYATITSIGMLLEFPKQTQLSMATREQDTIIFISTVPSLFVIIIAQIGPLGMRQLNSQIQQGRTAAIS